MKKRTQVVNIPKIHFRKRGLRLGLHKNTPQKSLIAAHGVSKDMKPADVIRLCAL